MMDEFVHAVLQDRRREAAAWHRSRGEQHSRRERRPVRNRRRTK